MIELSENFKFLTGTFIMETVWYRNTHIATLVIYPYNDSYLTLSFLDCIIICGKPNTFQDTLF